MPGLFHSQIRASIGKHWKDVFRGAFIYHGIKHEKQTLQDIACITFQKLNIIY